MPPINILFALICIFWLYFLLRPLVSRSAPDTSAREQLIEEKRGILFALRDAELDHQMGKLSEEDYGAARARLEAEITRVLAAVDEIGGGDAESRVNARLEELRAKEGHR